MDTIQGTTKKEGKGLDFAKDLGRQNAADLSRIKFWGGADNRFVGVEREVWDSVYEMFPFASHAELGYTLEFAKPELSAAGRVAMKYGHRLTMHPVSNCVR
jgi:UV DNA damage endonuclease